MARSGNRLVGRSWPEDCGDFHSGLARGFFGPGYAFDEAEAEAERDSRIRDQRNAFGGKVENTGLRCAAGGQCFEAYPPGSGARGQKLASDRSDVLEAV